MLKNEGVITCEAKTIDNCSIIENGEGEFEALRFAVCRTCDFFYIENEDSTTC